MNDAILKVLIRLFAIISNLDKGQVSDNAMKVMKNYLESMLSTDTFEEYWEIYVYWLEHYKRDIDKENEEEKEKIDNAFLNRVDTLCSQMNEQLNLNQKFYIIIQLLEYLKADGHEISDTEDKFVNYIADKLKFNDSDYLNCKAFILSKDLNQVPEQDKLLVVNGFSQPSIPNIKHINSSTIGIGEIKFLHIPSADTYIFRYSGEHNIYLNSVKVIQNKVHVFSIGSYMGSSRIRPLYYRNVVDQFHIKAAKDKFVLHVENVSFRFPDKNYGVKDLNFSEESGNLVGILGGSGTGKSTLLNVLNGNIKPTTGNVSINNYDVHQNRDLLRGIIGFVPQDDFLHENLTVYNNLYYNAKLCFSHKTEEAINSIVENILKEFGLYEARNLIVGDPLNKILSGGQRKRLNIALEVMRNPKILYVDEPTSGLSSMDSEQIINILKRQTLVGRLVFANIHQPSSDIFKQFDRLLVLDKGGTIIYYGNPIDAIVYFREITNHVNADERECPTCNNVRVEQILRIVEAKTVDEMGRPTENRKISPDEWHSYYKENIYEKKKDRYQKNKVNIIPRSTLNIPSKWKQLLIFIQRDLLTKIRNTQDMLFTFVLPPLLAFVLGYFSKFSKGTDLNVNSYIFSDNIYFTSYIFMSIIVAMFVGLMASAQEIIKDRKILQREKFLNLSWISYVNAKIIILFIISSIQAFLLVIVGNTMLEVKDSYFSFWLMLFACFSLSNMIGLNLSATIKSAVSIYILIPAIIVPQLLLGGMVIDYCRQYSDLAENKAAPWVSELVSSKTAYEGLMVHQFKENKYNKIFYKYDRRLSEVSYRNSFVIPSLRSKISQCEASLNDTNYYATIRSAFVLIDNEVTKLEDYSGIKRNYSGELTINSFKHGYKDSLRHYLTNVSEYFKSEYNATIKTKDDIYSKISKNKDILAFKNQYHNVTLENTVTNVNDLKKIIESETDYIQIMDPIYKKTDLNNGRSHFFAPEKKIASITVDTYTFDVINIFTRVILWILLLYIGFFFRIGRFLTRVRYFTFLKFIDLLTFLKLNWLKEKMKKILL